MVAFNYGSVVFFNAGPKTRHRHLGIAREVSVEPVSSERPYVEEYCLTLAPQLPVWSSCSPDNIKLQARRAGRGAHTWPGSGAGRRISPHLRISRTCIRCLTMRPATPKHTPHPTPRRPTCFATGPGPQKHPGNLPGAGAVGGHGLLLQVGRGGQVGAGWTLHLRPLTAALHPRAPPPRHGQPPTPTRTRHAQPRGAHAGDLLQHEPGDAGEPEHRQDQQAGRRAGLGWVGATGRGAVRQKAPSSRGAPAAAPAAAHPRHSSTSRQVLLQLVAENNIVMTDIINKLGVGSGACCCTCSCVAAGCIGGASRAGSGAGKAAGVVAGRGVTALCGIRRCTSGLTLRGSTSTTVRGWCVCVRVCAGRGCARGAAAAALPAAAQRCQELPTAWHASRHPCTHSPICTCAHDRQDLGVPAQRARDGRPVQDA